MLKIIKNNIKKTTIALAISIILIITILSFILFKINQAENEFKDIVHSRMNEKWNYDKINYIDKSEFKKEWIYKYNDINKPYLLYLFTTGYNDYSKKDNMSVLKADIKIENFKYTIEGETKIYSVFKNVSFNEFSKTLKENDFNKLVNSKISGTENKEFFFDPSSEPTQEQLEERKIQEQQNIEANKEIEKLKNRSKEEIVADEIKQFNQITIPYKRCLAGERNFTFIINPNASLKYFDEAGCNQIIQLYPEREVEHKKILDENK